MADRRIKYFAAALIAITLMVLCARIPAHTGKSRQIIVLSSEPDSQLIESHLQTFQYLPQKEALFSFLCLSDTAIKAFKRNHAIFLYGSLEDGFIDLLLDDEAARTVKTDTAALFRLDDVWTKGQMVVVLAVSEPRHVRFAIGKYGDMITRIFEDHYYEIIKQTHYRRGIDKRIGKILSKYGIRLDLNKGWLIDSTYADQGFIFVHAHFPDRSIFFYKTPYIGKISADSAVAIRNDLTRQYYDGDYALKNLSYTDPIEFKYLKGIRIKGIWQNDSLVAGGPFISYFFNRNDSLYVIDAMLFNPGERKSDFYAALEVILNSFVLH